MSDLGRIWEQPPRPHCEWVDEQVAYERRAAQRRARQVRTVGAWVLWGARTALMLWALVGCY